MLENKKEISGLQALLDKSYQFAGSHLKLIQVEDHRLSAEKVIEQLNGVCICDLATVGASGTPIVAPVDMLFAHGQAFVNTGRDSIRIRHIQGNPKVSLARTVEAELSILIHGIATIIDTEEYDFLHNLCIEHYGAEYDTWGIWSNPWFVITPMKMFATSFPPR